MRAIWKLRGTADPLAAEFGWEVPVLETVTCRVGEPETAARRQREEVQAFGALLPSETRERQGPSERQVFWFFTLP